MFSAATLFFIFKSFFETMQVPAVVCTGVYMYSRGSLRRFSRPPSRLKRWRGREGNGGRGMGRGRVGEGRVLGRKVNPITFPFAPRSWNGVLLLAVLTLLDRTYVYVSSVHFLPVYVSPASIPPSSSTPLPPPWPSDGGARWR